MDEKVKVVVRRWSPQLGTWVPAWVCKCWPERAGEIVARETAAAIRILGDADIWDVVVEKA